MSAEAYERSLRAIEQAIADETESDEILRRAVDLLHGGFVSFVEGDELALGPWNGPEATEHVRIPIGQGVCGSAAASGQTEIVDDVNADARYLACFASTRSEIVVPISYEGLVVAEIDIDSDRPAAFGQGDGEPWEP